MTVTTDNSVEERAENVQTPKISAPGVKKSPLGITISATLLVSWIGWLLYLAIRLNF